MSQSFWVLAVVTIGAVALSGCDSGGPGPGDADVDGDADEDSSDLCHDDAECSDGVFCNGQERCAPAEVGANEQGCLPGMGDPCLVGQECIETEGRCTTACDTVSDADGDGHDAIDCGGDDCNDADHTTFPGNSEICDAEHHDEDCDPLTFGFRDEDGDEFVDQECCNPDGAGGLNCGSDCNDRRIDIHPTTPELCDGVDNNCDGNVDEGLLTTYWIDFDNDGCASEVAGAASMDACTDPEGFAADRCDCNDSDATIYGGRDYEVCDGRDNDCDGTSDEGVTNACGGCGPVPEEVCEGSVDEDCDGSVDEGCACAIGETRRCGPATDAGACAYGTDTCAGGHWTGCVGAVMPAAEVCDAAGVDENCDGTANEGCTCTDWETRRCGESRGDCVQGTETCARGSWGDCVGAIGPATEVCDEGRHDEDCDGAIDEVCDCINGRTERCGATDTGVCEYGSHTCADGHWGLCLGGVAASGDYQAEGSCSSGGWCSDRACCSNPGLPCHMGCGSSGDFDYNCDGREERFPVRSGSCRLVDGMRCSGSGYSYTGSPACGSTVNYVSCSFRPGSCRTSTSTRPLPCR